MWLELMASSAQLPLLDKDIIFHFKKYCLIVFLQPEPQPNSITFAQWHIRQASHIANANVGRSLLLLKFTKVITIKPVSSQFF